MSSHSQRERDHLKQRLLNLAYERSDRLEDAGELYVELLAKHRLLFKGQPYSAKELTHIARESRFGAGFAKRYEELMYQTVKFYPDEIDPEIFRSLVMEEEKAAPILRRTNAKWNF